MASAEGEQMIMKQRESVRRDESAKTGPTDHHLCRHFQNGRALFASDSLERRLA